MFCTRCSVVVVVEVVAFYIFFITFFFLFSDTPSIVIEMYRCIEILTV